jgi:hypothetical protein
MQRVGLRSKLQLKFIQNTLKFVYENFRCGSTEKSNFHNPGAATGWWNWPELDSKCLDWCIDDHCIVYNVWTNSTELLEAVKSLPSMWLPTHCGSLLFAEHSPGLKDPMHNRNSLVEGNQVIRYWYHYYTSLCNALQSSRYCWRSYHRIKYCLESFEAVIANPVHCGGYTKKHKTYKYRITHILPIVMICGINKGSEWVNQLFHDLKQFEAQPILGMRDVWEMKEWVW